MHIGVAECRPMGRSRLSDAPRFDAAFGLYGECSHSQRSHSAAVLAHDAGMEDAHG
jgi:hypothetical protein